MPREGVNCDAVENLLRSEFRVVLSSCACYGIGRNRQCSDLGLFVVVFTKSPRKQRADVCVVRIVMTEQELQIDINNLSISLRIDTNNLLIPPQFVNPTFMSVGNGRRKSCQTLIVTDVWKIDACGNLLMHIL